MEMSLFGETVKSVYGLSGTSENSATAAMAWALTRSTHFRQRILKALALPTSLSSEARIFLQRSGPLGGFTDIELVDPGRVHAIIEAKKGWAVPLPDQLERYAKRLHRTAGVKRLFSLSAADPRYAKEHLPREVAEVPVTHAPWSAVLAEAQLARSAASSPIEKAWLTELIEHLGEFAQMQKPSDNTVFVVSLSAQPINPGNPYTWIDVVDAGGSYFHPIKSGWPAIPPNYLGFRYRGGLQSVHHVDEVKVVSDLRQVNRNWPKTAADHFVYRLGPAMRPNEPLPNGKLYPSGRYWCAIDTLLSGACRTVSAARDETDRRLKPGARARG